MEKSRPGQERGKNENGRLKDWRLSHCNSSFAKRVCAANILMNNEYNPNRHNSANQNEEEHIRSDRPSTNESPYYAQGDHSNYGGAPPPPKKGTSGVALGVIIVGLVAVLLFSAIAGFLLFLYKGYDLSLIHILPVVALNRFLNSLAPSTRLNEYADSTHLPRFLQRQQKRDWRTEALRLRNWVPAWYRL